MVLFNHGKGIPNLKGETKMKTAKELHEMCLEVMRQEVEKEKEQALEAIEKEIAHLVEGAARRGDWHYTYQASSSLAAETIAPKLEELGYDTRRTGRKLDISWARG